MAMACFLFLTVCLPSFTCSISSRTNSPAWVVGALPSRASLRALSIVFFSGMALPMLHGGGQTIGKIGAYEIAALPSRRDGLRRIGSDGAGLHSALQRQKPGRMDACARERSGVCGRGRPYRLPAYRRREPVYGEGVRQLRPAPRIHGEPGRE